MLYLIKVIISALLVVTVAEVSKRSASIGGIVASLPVVSILALTWLYMDTKDAGKVAALATSTLWYVVPSLALFIALPLLLRAGVSFWISMAVAVAVTGVCYLLMATILHKMQVKL